jgi:hypothetical protein
MRIKLKKNYRAFGKVNKAGESLEINEKNILEFLKENNYIEIEKIKIIKSKTKINKIKK